MTLLGALESVVSVLHGLEPFRGSSRVLQGGAPKASADYKDYGVWCEVEATNLRESLETFDTSMTLTADGVSEIETGLFHAQVGLLVSVSARDRQTMYRGLFTMMDPTPNVLVPGLDAHEMPLSGSGADRVGRPQALEAVGVTDFETSVVRELERLSAGEPYYDAINLLDADGCRYGGTTDDEWQHPSQHLEEVCVKGVYRVQDDVVGNANFAVLRFELEIAVKGNL